MGHYIIEMNLAPLICLAGMAPMGLGIDGEEAVKRADAVISKFGILCARKLVTVNKVPTQRWGYPSECFWSVAFVRPDGRFIQVHLTTEGRILNFWNTYGKEEDWPRRGQSGARPSEARGAQLLARIDHKPCVLNSIGGGEHVLAASYDLLVNGLRFFNLNPHYGYYLTWEPDTGELVSFQGLEDTPKPNALKPRVSATRANLLLQAYAKNNGSRDGIARILQPDWPAHTVLKPELGYYKFKNEPTARLVWRGMVGTTEAGKFQESGALRMYVDALTGKTVAPDDPAMG